jgi:hypothetical protein
MVDKNMLDKLDHKMQVMFAVFCAKQVLHLLSNKDKTICLNAIAVAEGFIEGRVVEYKYENSMPTFFHMPNYLVKVVSIYGFSSYFGESVAYSAVNTQNANKKVIEQEQIRYYNELLNFDKIVEEMMGL